MKKLMFILVVALFGLMVAVRPAQSTLSSVADENIVCYDDDDDPNDTGDAVE